MPAPASVLACVLSALVLATACSPTKASVDAHADAVDADAATADTSIADIPHDISSDVLPDGAQDTTDASGDGFATDVESTDADAGVDTGSPAVPLCSGCTWTLLPGKVNIGRQDARATWGGGHLYLWGGTNTPSNMRGPCDPTIKPQCSEYAEATVERYDPVTGNWTLLPKPPMYPGLAPGVWGGDRLYLYGKLGYVMGPTTWTPVPADGAYWSETAAAWTTLPEDNSPLHRVGNVVHWVDDKLFVLGGKPFPSEPIGKSGSYDPQADQWIPLAVPASLASADTAVIGDSSIFDGAVVYLRTVGIEYHVQSKQWLTFPPNPPKIPYNQLMVPWQSLALAVRPGGGFFLLGRGIGASYSLFEHLPGGQSYIEHPAPPGVWLERMALVSGKIVIYGINETSSFAGLIYDPSLDTWELIASPLPGTSTGGSAIAVLADGFYVIAGSSPFPGGGGNYERVDVWRLQVP